MPERAAQPPTGRIERHAPAKINLALRVLGRRRDGYHELDSVFLPLEWGDNVSLEVRPAVRTRIGCHCAKCPDLAGPENLACRAAAAWLEAHGVTAEVEITLDKRIWVAAGLGGGSSDAGAVLRGLDALCEIPASETRDPAHDLATLALALGADVPFFLDPRPARVRGIGEQIEPLEGPLGEIHIVLANPGVPLATAEVFSGLGLAPGARLDPPPLPIADATGAAPVEQLRKLVVNDLEPVAARLCPAVPMLREVLGAAGAAVTGLSGSGPTVFGLFSDAAVARAAAAKTSTIHGFSAVCTRPLGA